jgi:hypothetical protein
MENLEPNGMEWSGMKNIPWDINNMEWNIKNMDFRLYVQQNNFQDKLVVHFFQLCKYMLQG